MTEKKYYLQDYLAHFLFFLTLLLFGEQMGFYSSSIYRIWGSFFFLIYLILVYKQYSDNWEKKNKLKTFAFGLIIMLMTIIAPLSTISIGLALLIPLSISQTERILEFKVGLLFFVYSLFHSFFPQFFLLEKIVGDGLNFFIKSISGLPIKFSPDGYGFGGLVIIVGYCIFEVLNIPKNNKYLTKKLMSIIFIMLGFVFFQIIYFLFSKNYYNISPPIGTGMNEFLYYFMGLFLPMNGQGIIFILTFPMALFWKSFFFKKDRHTNRELIGNSLTRPIFHCVLTILLLSAALFAFYFNLDFSCFNSNNPVVYVYDTKMDFTTVPNDKVFGINNGMFGMMRNYFEDWGYRVQFGTNWGKINAKDHDILLLLNPNGQLNNKEKQRLKSFMYQGGNLLVLGDHTYTFGLTNGYFDFFKEMGITFNFDAAFPFRPLWRNCLKSPYYTWDNLVRMDGFTSGIDIGASLSLKYPATPLIIGQSGWSDLGNLKNKWYMGDRHFSPNEPTGDLVLAAERSFGKGKLMVFGDTTFLQNTPLSYAYPLARLTLFHMLPKKNIVFCILISFLFLGLAVMLILLKKQERVSIHLIILLLLAVLWIGSIEGTSRKFFRIPLHSKQTRAVIDYTFFPEFYVDDWGVSNREIGGLKNTLYRINTLPYILYQYDLRQLNPADYLFIIAPKERMSLEKAKETYNFVQRGGILVCASGFDHREQIHSLLNLLEIDIENIPLSYLNGKDTNQNIRFVSAWPIKVSKKKKYKLVCQAMDQYPLIVEFNEGKGKVLFVGDSYFFENRNLEERNLYYKNNLLFVEHLLDDLRK